MGMCLFLVAWAAVAVVVALPVGRALGRLGAMLDG